MTKKKKYTAHSIITKSDAQIVGSYIEEKDLDGSITPEFLVQIAQPKTSPIHHLFEWDDKKAGEKYRLHQARMILASIEVIEDGTQVKAFYNISTSDDRKYYSLEAARADENLWENVIESALKEVEYWREKYKTYKELSLISKAIDKTIQKIRK